MPALRRPEPSGTDVLILLLIGLAYACFVWNAIMAERPRHGGTVTAVEGAGDANRDKGDVR